jgi:hypothetical protein
MLDRAKCTVVYMEIFITSPRDLLNNEFLMHESRYSSKIILSKFKQYLPVNALFLVKIPECTFDEKCMEFVVQCPS